MPGKKRNREEQATQAALSLGDSDAMRVLRKTLRKIKKLQSGDAADSTERRAGMPGPGPEHVLSFTILTVGEVGAEESTAEDQAQDRITLSQSSNTPDRAAAPEVRIEPAPYDLAYGSGARSGLVGTPEWPIYRVLYNQGPADNPGVFDSWEDDMEAFTFDLQGVSLDVARAWAEDNLRDGEFFLIKAVVHGTVDIDWLFRYSFHPERPKKRHDSLPGATEIRVFGPWPAAGVFSDDLRDVDAAALPKRIPDKKYPPPWT